jgi:hypothetical protein
MVFDLPYTAPNKKSQVIHFLSIGLTNPDKDSYFIIAISGTFISNVIFISSYGTLKTKTDWE